MPQVRQLIKNGLIRIGAVAPSGTIRAATSALDYVRAGHFGATWNHPFPKLFPNREALWGDLASEIGEKEVLYLEFGVARGDAMRTWSALLGNPASVLHGFDSFDGLPESWDTGRSRLAAGTFSTGGHPPKVADERVRFYPGLFKDTLPDYTPPPHDQLVLNIDADLYSSTRCVLSHMDRWIKPGSYLYFDEFSVAEHELRAFDEYLIATQKQFELLSADWGWRHVLFRCRA